MEDIEKLEETIKKMEPEEFIVEFLEWLYDHDDADITCMTDVIDTLLTECEDELSRAAENMIPRIRMWKAILREQEGFVCVAGWDLDVQTCIIMDLKADSSPQSPNPAKAWAELPDIMVLAAERLRGVQIENLPALEILKRYNTPDVFIYADPPYLHETRKNYLYKHEMTDHEHEELLRALLAHPGSVMISGYDNDLYDRYLNGWRKVQKDTLAEGGLKRTETLWMNYSEMQMSFEKDFPEVMP